MKKITKDKWIWMPHPAHFICSQDCRFVMATKVGKYIVSTVGEMWNDRQVREIHAEVHDPEWLIQNKHLRGDDFDSAYFKKFGYAEIGLDRKYESMVFKAKKALPGNGEICCPFRIIVSENVDYNSYNESADAYKGHLKLCDKWAKKQ